MTDAQFASIAKALADPRRYRILSEVAAANAPLPCSALHDMGQVSAPTISHHLRELELAGLIDVTRQGKQAILRLNRDVLAAYLARLSSTLMPPP
jgi:ArsR family transcriptional regulator, arsenate/arsenite/antimonite-responsive transcriptional repressor